MACYTWKQLLIAYKGWREIHVHQSWEQTRYLMYFSGNHGASSPEDLLPLEIDDMRLREQVEVGRSKLATIRKQTDEEKALLAQVKRLHSKK